MEPVTSFESDRYFSPEDFARWCAATSDDLNRYELLNGRIVMNPPSGWPHGEIGVKVSARLFNHAREHALGRVFGPDQGFELPSGDTVAPDASWVSAARWTAGEPHQAGRFLKVVPDLVVEVLSASTASRDRGEKKAIYERNGVREFWLLDPAARRISRFVLKERVYGAPEVFEDGAHFRSTVLPLLEFAVMDLMA